MRQARGVMIAVVFLSACVRTVSGEGVRKFDLYGFMDMTVENMQFISDGSMYEFIGLDEDFHVRLTHVNLYFDFKPNERLRSLAEIRFLTQANDKGLPGYITDITFLPTNAQVSDTTQPQTTDDQVISDYSSGGYLTWRGISVERAWFEIAFHQYFNLLLGQFLTPVGIWNIDHGSPAITTVMAPYGFSFLPLFPVSQIGFAGHGSFFIGKLDLEYWMYLSSGRGALNFESIRDVAVGGNVRVGVPAEKRWLEEVAIGVSGYTGMLRDQTAWSRVSLTIDVFNPDQNAQFGDGFSDPANKSSFKTTELQAREIAWGLDLKARLIKGLTVQSEFLHQVLLNHLDNDAVTNTFDWYGLLQYRIRAGSKLSITPYAMYERLWSNDADNNPASWFSGNEQMRGQVIDAFSITTLGLNFNLFTNFTVKIEGNYINAHTVSVQRPYQDIWDMCTFKTQFVLAL